STGACVLRVDWEESDPFEKGTSRSRREPTAGGALQGDHVSYSARCAERRRCGRSRKLWSGATLGSDGTEITMSSRRWHRRHKTFHGSYNSHIDRNDQNFEHT